jgi:hypothetical protein
MSEAFLPLDPTPTDWHGQADAPAHPRPLCRRASLQAARPRRGPALGRLPRLPAGLHARQRIRGFTQTEIRLDVDFTRSSLFLDPAALQGFGGEQALANADFDRALTEAGRGALWRRREPPLLGGRPAAHERRRPR